MDSVKEKFDHISGIPEKLQEHLLSLLPACLEIERVILFGSRARGDAEERADIDLAIVAPTATPRQWLDISFRLEEVDTLVQNPTSDIDIGILTDDEPIDIELSLARESLADSTIPLTIELVDLNRTSADFKAQVLREGILLWTN